MLQDGLPDWQCQCWVVIAQISLAVVMGCLGRGETVTGTALQSTWLALLSSQQTVSTR